MISFGSYIEGSFQNYMFLDHSNNLHQEHKDYSSKDYHLLHIFSQEHRNGRHSDTWRHKYNFDSCHNVVPDTHRFPFFHRGVGSRGCKVHKHPDILVHQRGNLNQS
jgi:hypothetical protein